MKLRAPTTTDGYKLGHAEMYADGTQQIYSNLTPRSDKIYRRNCSEFYDNKMVWIGAQGAVQEIVEMWDESFFSCDKEEAVSKFKDRVVSYLGSETKTVKLLGDLWELGHLPLEIKSLEEGSKVPMGVPVMTVTNEYPEFYWLVNYLETVISALVWKPATIATIAAEFRAIGKAFGEETGTDEFTQLVQFHDFSMRGMSGPEDAARTGFGHLVSFIGTDSLPAIDYAEQYYDASGMIAISVPATEHSVSSNNIISIEKNGNLSRLDSEREFMRDLITRKFPNGIVSYVSDTYDYWSVVTEVLPSLKNEIMSRGPAGAAPGKLVIRPDSGDPVQVICGTVEHFFDTLQEAEVAIDQEHWEIASNACEGSHCMGDSEYKTVVYVKDEGKYYELTSEIDYNRHDKTYYYVDSQSDIVSVEVEPTPEMKGSIECLWEIFGGTITDKGYKLLDSHIGLIYGDSITIARANRILTLLKNKGFASGNVVFGIGSYSYQMVTRDCFGTAMKATYSVVNGEPIEIFKAPKTDSKKSSAKGLLFVGKNESGYYLEDQVSPEKEASDENELKTIFKQGKFVKRVTLDQIRETLKSQ